MPEENQAIQRVQDVGQEDSEGELKESIDEEFRRKLSEKLSENKIMGEAV